MSLYILSMLLTVISNCAYHLCQKQTSATANPLVSLFFTYLTGMALTLVCAPVFYPDLHISSEIKNINWASFGLGFAIVGLELGFLLAYRAGWNLSLGALYSNVLVTMFMIPVGIIFFHEHLSLKNWMGILFAVVGILLISDKPVPALK